MQLGFHTWYFALMFLAGEVAYSANPVLPDFLPASPESPYLSAEDGEPDMGFCSQWNPEWGLRGIHCCSSKTAKFKKVKGNRCSPKRFKSSFCDEMTEEQRQYVEAAEKGELGDLLEVISSDLNRRVRNQAQCTVNNGFLVWGRPLLTTTQNQIRLKNPGRCTHFGTDGMVGMLDWLGREMVAEQEQSLLVGDISAPRGGCLSGRGGRRGHLSHTSGLDVDIGFIFTHKRAPATFTKDFEAEPNWLMLKKIFQNPFACVKMVLLDRKWISKMNRVAVNDPYWPEIRRFVKHAKHHKNHFHVRVGELPGAPGCNQPFEPVIDEDEGEGDGGEDAATSRSELAQKIEQEVDEDPPLDENTLEIDTDDLASQMARPIPARIIPSGERMGPRATQ